LLELFAFLPTTSPLWRRDVPDAASETVRAVRERLEGRLEYLEAEAQRVRSALARIEAVSPRAADASR